MLILNNVATQDAYAQETTLESEFGGRLVYLVANQSAVARFRPLVEHGGSSVAEYGAEQVLTPQSSFIDKISGVQFRSAVAGTPARVVATLSEPGDILPASGTPFTGTLAASGGFSEVAVGEEVAYQEFTANVAVGVAPGTTVVNAPSFDADGVSFYLVEFFAPLITPNIASSQCNIRLFDVTAALELGIMSVHVGTDRGHVFERSARRLFFSAGARQLRITAVMTAAGVCTIQAGLGGVGVLLPGFVRVTKAT